MAVRPYDPAALRGACPVGYQWLGEQDEGTVRMVTGCRARFSFGNLFEAASEMNRAY